MSPTDRAYVDRPVTDLTAATRAASGAARHWELEPPVLLRTGMNAIFVAGDTVLRVSSPNAPAEVSLELASFWLGRSVAVPRPARDDVVTDGEYRVTAWERIEPRSEPIDWVAVGSLVRRVHETDRAALPAGVPLPAPSSLPWWDFDALLARAAPALDGPARAGLEAAIRRHRGWSDPAGAVVCHGDVHPGNVMMDADGPVLLDWDLLCLAPPGWDHGPMLTWAERWGGAPGEYDAFARGYGRSFRDDVRAQAFAELRLVAATLMRVVAAQADPSAWPEAERRLRYWRGDRDAPPWAPQ